MTVFNKNLLIIIFVFVSQNSFTQEIDKAKSGIQNYMDAWLNSSTDENWLIDINGVKFPSKGIEVGFKVLEENLQKSDISNSEKKQIKERFVQTYLDQSAILASSYKELIESSSLDILLQEFLRQAATQFWLEKQMLKDPEAIVPTQEEINQYYSENSDRLLRLGLSASQIKSYTEQELRQTKLQNWTYRQLLNFNTNNPIIVNPKLKKKFGIK